MFRRTLLVGLIVASPAWATKTQFFKHATRADFAAGTMENVVATNFGELKLAHAVETVMADEGRYASIDAMVEAPDGTVYLGTTASGKLLALRDGKTSELADFGEAASVSALAIDAAGNVYVGVSGERAEVHVLRKGEAKPARLAMLPEGTQYVWAIAVAADGKLYLGTGPDGRLFELTADGAQQRVVFDGEDDHLRAVLVLNDTLFVGTDPNGLILKIDRAGGKAFVIFDAPETEVSTLLIDPRGGQIYAATSQLVEAAGETEEDATSSTGRPNADTSPRLEASAGDAPEPPSGDGQRDGALTATPAAPAVEAAVDLDAGPATRPGLLPSGSNAGPSPTSKPDADDAADDDAGEAAADGNAVYRIEPQGFVSEVFRADAMIFGLARQGDELFIATGPGGLLHRLDLTSEEHVAIATLRPPQATSVLATTDGRVLVGTGGGSAELSMLASGLARSGTYTSPVLDATQVSLFGKLQMRGAVPAGATMTVAVRSGNVGDEESPLWSEWSPPVPAARFTEVSTPGGRYAQYRVTLAGDGKATPTLDAVSWAYLQPNVAPRIDSVSVAAAEPSVDEATGESTGNPQRTIEWTSTEPNGDDLRFTISARSGPGVPWTVIAKDQTGATYAWDTRRVADGEYEVRVEASDALANDAGTAKVASRVSERVVVDNAPPLIGDVKIERANGKVTIGLGAVDRGGVVAKLEYRVDDAERWQAAPPSDMLSDSPAERYAIVLPEVGAATRVVSLRCQDEFGNTAHGSVTVRPEAK